MKTAAGLFAILLLAPLAALHAAPSAKPNILFILADDLGYGDWKLILPQGRGKAGKGAQAGGELFNLCTDLAEQRNLFSEEFERAQRMQAQLKAILAK